VITRIAAVIFTGGASIIGTTLWDGARAAPNPCLVALAAAPMEPKQMTQSDQPARKRGVNNRPEHQKLLARGDTKDRTPGDHAGAQRY